MPTLRFRSPATLLLATALLLGCGKAERDSTTIVLANAHAADVAVEISQAGYGQAFSGASDGWGGVGDYQRSPTGREVMAFLEQYRRPVVVPDGFRRTAEIREVSLVTAELVSLALEPRGTWISYGQEMNALRTRFNRALLALETGTKEEVLRNAKGEAGSRLGSLRLRIQTAEAKAEVTASEMAEDSRRAREEAERAQAEDLMRRAAAEEETRKRREAEAAVARQKMLDESIRRSGATPTQPPAVKLGGGTFPVPPK